MAEGCSIFCLLMWQATFFLMWSHFTDKETRSQRGSCQHSGGPSDLRGGAGLGSAAPQLLCRLLSNSGQPRGAPPGSEPGLGQQCACPEGKSMSALCAGRGWGAQAPEFWVHHLRASLGVQGP